MSNIIDKIRISGVTYTISGSSSGGNPTVELTQAQYDALVESGSVQTDTYYIITDAPEINLSGYAQTSAVTAALSNYVPTSAVTSAVTSASTNSQIPSALAVYAATSGGGGSSVNVVQTTGTSTTDVMSQNAVTTELNNKANKTAAVGGYQFGSSNNVGYLQYKNANNTNIGNSIYYPKINGNGILTNNGTWAQSVYNFQLVETSAITSSITSSSTDAQVPSAKAVYDQLGGLKLQKITQSDYDLLPTKNSNTLYIIT